MSALRVQLSAWMRKLRLPVRGGRRVREWLISSSGRARELYNQSIMPVLLLMESPNVLLVLLFYTKLVIF